MQRSVLFWKEKQLIALDQIVQANLDYSPLLLLCAFAVSLLSSLQSDKILKWVVAELGILD